MIISKTAARNREIFASYQHGTTVENLARQHGLMPGTILEIVRIERHKVSVCVDDFYEALRASDPEAQRAYLGDGSERLG